MNGIAHHTVTLAGRSHLGGGEADLRVGVVCLTPPQADVALLQITLTHSGCCPAQPEAIRLSVDAAWIPACATDVLGLYKEGLTVVGVAASRRFHDCDFELDPSYLPLTVSDPGTYDWNRPGCFHAEQVGVLRNEQTGEAVLVGWVTAHLGLGRVIVESSGEPDLRVRVELDLSGLEVAAGETVMLETLMLARGFDVERLLEAYADALGSRMGVLKTSPIPSGWCSYYQYYGRETESDILENARFLAEHRSTLPVGVIQIDDGWQAARGNWQESHAEKFPAGMADLARQIRELGFTPGIWVAPFLVARQAPVYRDHPEWLLRDQAGERLSMGDNHILDPTHPDAQIWLKQVFVTLREWGYAYFKLDFLFVATHARAHYHARGRTRLQAYRTALSIIREAVGPTSFLLGGTSLMAPTVGLVDGCRISTDVTPFWGMPDRTPESPAIENVCRNIINRGYMHRRLWINDPDCLIVREAHGRAKYAHVPSLTRDETRMLATAMILSGGALFLGDRLSQLPPDRVAMLETVFALSNGRAAHPLDRLSRVIPRCWFREGGGTRDAPHLLGVFNWGDSPWPVSVEGLGDGWNTSGWRCSEVWDDGPWIGFEAIQNVLLSPHSCRLFSIVVDPAKGC